MGYREVDMWEILEVLRRLHRAEPNAAIGLATGRSPKTIRRYERLAKELGWVPGLEEPSEELAGKIHRRLRPVPPKPEAGLSEKRLLPRRAEIERWLIEGDSVVVETGLKPPTAAQSSLAAELRSRLFAAEPPLAVEARKRYGWVREALPGVLQTETVLRQRGAQLIEWINRPWVSTVLFLLTMAIVFQAVFAWAAFFSNPIDSGTSRLGSWLGSVLRISRA